MVSWLLPVCLFLGFNCFERISAENKCCLTTCVYVAEERCNPIIKQVEKRLGTSAQRVYVQEYAASRAPEMEQPTHNDEKARQIVNSAMDRIDRLRTTITDILTKFEEFSENLKTSLSAGASGEAMEVSLLQAQLDHLNAEYSAVRASLGQQERFSCNRFAPSTAPPPEDQCSSRPCQNGGTCQETFCCRCPSGFSGTQCETVDDCASDPCTNGGSCYDGVDGFLCVCPVGYGGINCEQDTDDCERVMCQNGGTCVDGFNSYTCICLRGYNGTHCENNINDCAGVTCRNGGTCQDGVNSYNCSCVLGYNGTHCENDIDDCMGVSCLNNGTCNDGVNSYNCSCVPGYNGTHCENDIDDCMGVTCLNEGTCQDGVNSYQCFCVLGYIGTYCENDNDECSSGPCQNGGTCQDAVNRYTCSCPSGYSGGNCQNNIDDCAGVTCQYGGTCLDGVNSYSCQCPEGHIGTYCETSLPNLGWRRGSSTLWYKLYYAPVSYDHAKTVCAGLGNGIRLPSTGLRDSTIASNLGSWLTSIGQRRIWIGLRKSRGQWHWSDGAVGGGIWVPGKPDGTGDCGHIYVTNPFGVDDVRCDDSRKYLCEWNIG